MTNNGNYSAFFITRCAKKITIKDWHLIVCVVAITALPALMLAVYGIYEGVVNKYEALIEPSVERPSTVTGVSPIGNHYSQTP